jgi:hypothetical protein
VDGLTLEEAYSPEADGQLRRLVARITLSAGAFAFYPVACSLPEPLIDALTEDCRKKGITLLRLDLSSELVQDLRVRVLELTPSPLPDNSAIMITGLEPSILLDGDEKRPAILQIMNLARESFQASFPCPFILSLAASALGKVQEVAPDFWAWRKGATLKFRAAAKLFRQELQQALLPGEIGGWMRQWRGWVGWRDCRKHTKACGPEGRSRQMCRWNWNWRRNWVTLTKA